MGEKLKGFVKKETVLCVAWVLAVLSAFLVRPGAEYVDYIDFKSLGILWCLMVIVSGLRKNGLFDRIGKALLDKTKYLWQLTLLLVLLPFFLSMLITNDVALLTFVPFAIYILKMSGRERLLIPVVALQTLAANLGSMLTPIGNPQNLYLYGISGLKMDEFIVLMLPYTMLSMVLLVAGVLTIRGKRERICVKQGVAGIEESRTGSVKWLYWKDADAADREESRTGKTQLFSRKDADAADREESRTDMLPWLRRRDANTAGIEENRAGMIPWLRRKNVFAVVGEESWKNILYGFLFLLAVCGVAFPKQLPYQVMVLIVFAVFFLCDREVILRADYSLLLTFIGFFIFTGNLGRMKVVRDFMIAAVKGHEALAGVVSSQFISNVPAALLLSGFTGQIRKLIVGVNLGGLGTLIASMASLISFKLLTDEYHEMRGKYFWYFTAMSVIFLGVLLVENVMLQYI